MIPKNATLRIARPTDNLADITQMYTAGLGFELLASFVGHNGFDGAIIGHQHHPYHLEFTHHQGTTVGRAPSQDNLLVFYIADQSQWQAACQRLLEAGFAEVAAYNDFWDESGRTFEDLDGYRVVIHCSEWHL